MYENDDDTSVVTMYLTVSKGNSSENTYHTWKEINSYSVYDYEDMGVERYQVAGLLQVGDENGPTEGEVGYGERVPNATVQIRGQTSSQNAQKNYKIELKKNKGTWRGQRTINLNKHMTEGMRFRNKLAYDLIRGIPQMVGLRTQFVHLYVKDNTEESDGKFEDYGIYTQVEQLNKTALKSHGLDSNGQLYKINSFEFYRYEDIIKKEDDAGYDKTAFEKMLEIKGDSDHTKLIDMLTDLNDYSIGIEDVLKEHFDEENIVYWMAFQILMGNVDTQNRNVYLYSPLNSDIWYFIAWDNDGCLMRSEYELKNFSDQGSTGSLSGPLTGNIQEWTCVSEDREKAVGFLMQKLVSPNTQFEYYRPNGLNPEARYHFYNRSLKYNVKEFGDLVNTVAPVHIRQDSVAHNLIAKFVKMDGEAEDFCAYGDALMYAGVKLKQAFGGTGYNEQIRHFPDFASRMYFMEQMND